MSSRETNRDDCLDIGDAAPYVLGALDDGERYSEHLRTCASCRAEVAELQLVADALPASVAPAVAPESLRDRVLATVRSEAELLHAAGHEADEPPRQPGRWRARRLSLLSTSVAIVATAATIVAIALAIGVSSTTHERVITAQVSPSLPGARASLRQFGGHAELVVSGMRQPRAGMIYEVWVQRGNGSPQPANALFSVNSRGSGSASVPTGLDGVRSVLVTSEPLGGSLHPTSAPVIRVALAA